MATIPAREVASPAVEAPKPRAYAPSPGLTGALTPARVLALQRTVGNRAVGNLLAREPATAAPEEEATEAEALTWPTALANANRAAGHELKLEQSKQAPTLQNEAEGGPLSGAGDQLSEEQKRVKKIVTFIANRRKLDTSFLKLQAYTLKGAKAPTAGYAWNGSSDAGTTPTDVKQDAPEGDSLAAKRKEAQRWIWEEFSHEGSSVSINAYDEAHITWGRGMAASGGHLQNFLGNLPPEVKGEFLNYGIEVGKAGFRVVNVATGAIEAGADAMSFMQAHPEVLAALKVVGEGHRQEVVDAQWKEMKTAAVNVPDTVLGWGWDKPAIQLVAHFHHAGDNYGWGKADYYKAEGGPDPAKLWQAWMKLLAGKPEANGLWLVSSQTHHIAELRTWGGGAALQSLSNASVVKATKAELTGADFLQGHIAMVHRDAASYYVWPRLSLEQEKSLGGGADREYFNRLNGLSMTDILDELKAREKDIPRWTANRDTKILVSGESNAERIFFAMDVVKSGKVPARKGDALVPEGQIAEAQEWASAHAKKK